MAVQTTLLLASLSTLVVATAYLLVGHRLGRGRSFVEPSERALRLFSLWWIATALNQYAGALLYMGAAFGHVDLEVQLTYVLLQRFLLAASLVGLMHYLVYLLTGRQGLGALVAFYGAYYALQVYGVTSSQPVGVEVHGWRTDLAYAVESPSWVRLLNFAWLVLPPVVGALGLSRLLRRADDRSRRVRIAAVSWGFVLWWVLAVVAGQRAALDVDWLQALNRAVGLLVAVAILLAYQPTPWMRRRFGLEPYGAPA